MSSNQLPTPLSRADYDTIEAAVMETERGRWFLAEYARRNRHSDTERVLAAIERLEGSVAQRQSEALLQGLGNNLSEMANAIAVAHAEMARIRPDGVNASRLYEATGELDAVVRATEIATSTILGATERLQEHAWTLREQGLPEAQCDMMDACATEIYAACGFQDVTAQRTRKVIDTLNFIEGRIKAMMAAWNIGTPSCAANCASARIAEIWPGDPALQSTVDRTFGDGGSPAQSQPADPPPAANALARLDALSIEDRLRLCR